jgi:tRNA(Arg) A34 adenosine deaminase TadA
MLHFGKQVGRINQPYLHAEVAALLKCKEKKPYAMHIERFRKDGTPGLAKPCPICEAAIRAWGVQQITYTCG